MALYSNTYLENLSEAMPLNESQRLFSTNRALSTFDIFLAHSFLDKASVRGLFFELTRMGFSVYVDWIIDPQLDRADVTKENAALVRERLRSSKSLLLAISINATLSKWVPWELGWVDGHTDRCAIVPVSNKPTPQTSYKGREYLSIYPFITKVKDISNVQRAWVVEAANRYVRIDKWVEGTQPFNRKTKIFS
jgi:hypothetical protein